MNSVTLNPDLYPDILEEYVRYRRGFDSFLKFGIICDRSFNAMVYSFRRTRKIIFFDSRVIFYLKKMKYEFFIECHEYVGFIRTLLEIAVSFAVQIEFKDDAMRWQDHVFEILSKNLRQRELEIIGLRKGDFSAMLNYLTKMDRLKCEFNVIEFDIYFKYYHQVQYLEKFFKNLKRIFSNVPKLIISSKIYNGVSHGLEADILRDLVKFVDDASQKEIFLRIIMDIGFRCIDCIQVPVEYVKKSAREFFWESKVNGNKTVSVEFVI
uniref:Maturase K n=1 Tax=Panagrolaimus sp. JU765 TaxID=591449 RepID=A0AC34Q3V5_9BILA